MKVTDKQIVGSLDTTAVKTTGDEKLDALIAKLASSKSLAQIGGALRGISEHLPANGETAQVQPALTTAMKSKPEGVRPLIADVEAKEIKLFCGEATPNGVRKMARDAGVPIGAKDFKVFSTSDPFTYLGTPPDTQKKQEAKPEDVRRKTVMVVQGDEGYTLKEGQERYDRATLVAEAFQIAFAARSNGAKKTIVVLPETLDPAKNPDDRFAALVARLAKASGVDELRYHAGLDTKAQIDASTSQGVRAGLPALGPKTKEVSMWLDTLAGASDVAGVQRAVTQLDIALTGLKGKYGDQAEALASQVASVLIDKMSRLVPGLGGATAEIVDDRTVVFAGQSNPKLGELVAHEMGAELAKNTVQFSRGSPFVELGAQVKDRKAVIVQTTRQDPYTAPEAKQSAMALLAEALLLCDEARKAGASETTLVLPYMPNARSDKQDQKGVGAYAALVARWVDELKLGEVVLVEPHDTHVPHFFRTPVRVVSGAEILARQVIEELGRDKLVLVRPDEGATKRTKELAKVLDLPMVDGQKTRSDNNEKATVQALGNKSDVEGKVCLVTDDEIATGGTMRQTVGLLKENGAEEIHVAVSHANMPLEPDKRHAAMRALRDSGATRLYLLDTQPVGKLPADLQDFVHVISVAKAVAEEAK